MRHVGVEGHDVPGLQVVSRDRLTAGGERLTRMRERLAGLLERHMIRPEQSNAFGPDPPHE